MNSPVSSREFRTVLGFSFAIILLLACPLSDRASAMARFGRLFMGKLWDVYARNVLTSGPF